jgi:hypothetical protein
MSTSDDDAITEMSQMQLQGILAKSESYRKRNRVCRIWLFPHAVIPSPNKSRVYLYFPFEHEPPTFFSRTSLANKVIVIAAHTGMHDKDSRWRQPAKKFRRKIVDTYNTDICQWGPLWHSVTNLYFLRWGVVSLTLNPQTGGPLLLGCPLLLIQYILSYSPYLEAVSSIRDLRTRHAVVTRRGRGWGDMDFIDLAQDRDRWSALVYTVMNLRVP